MPAKRRAEYLVYVPDGGPVTLNLSGAAGNLTVEWFNPQTGSAQAGKAIAGGGSAILTAPFPGEAVLYLRARS